MTRAQRRRSIGRRFRRLLLACCLLVAMGRGEALAQFESETAQFSTFAVEKYRAELFVDAFYYSDSDERAGSSFEQTELYFEEGVQLWTDGYIYHPKLVDWTASFRVGVSQDDYNSTNESAQNTGELLGYNLSALILKEKPVSGRVFSTMNNAVVARSFTRPVQIESRSEGAELRYRGPVAASLLLEHRVLEQESEYRTEDEDALLARLKITDDDDRDRVTDLVYEHEDEDRILVFNNPTLGTSFEQDLSGVRDEVNVNNRWVVGGEGELKHWLTGNARALSRTGYFNHDHMSINQRLDLAHSPSLTSFYSGGYSIDETDFQSQTSMRAEAGLTKRYYKSLIVTPRVQFEDFQYEDGSETSIGVFLDADYTKQTPLGLYTSSLSIGRLMEEEQFEGGQRNVADEAVTLTGITFTALSRPNVVTGSVFVTDLTNTIVYVEGVDYEVQAFGSFTEIRRLVTGAITDGQTVLVDYVVEGSTNAEFTTDLFRWANRLRFDKVPASVYVEYAIRRQSLTGGENPRNLEQDTHMLIGAEYYWGPVTVAAEYETRQLDLSPSWEAYRLRANLHMPLSAETAINAGAVYEMLEYTNGDEFSLEPGRDYRDSLNLFANITTKPQKNLLLRLEASYFKSEGRSNDELLRIGPSLTWTAGAMDVTISGYQAWYTQEDLTGETTYFSFSLRRQF